MPVPLPNHCQTIWPTLIKVEEEVGVPEPIVLMTRSPGIDYNVTRVSGTTERSLRLAEAPKFMFQFTHFNWMWRFPLAK